MSFRADRILPHHRFHHSLGAPLARVRGTVGRVFASPEHHHGANHQQFTVIIGAVLDFQGGNQDIAGQTVFVAARFGDTEGLDHEIEGLASGSPIELQGEYISSADAYPTEDNRDPVLPVIHFVHHPVGFVLYQGTYYS